MFLYLFSYAAAACDGSGHCQDDLDRLLAAEERLPADNAPIENGSGLSITVDGEALVGSASSKDRIRITDKNLENVDIQVKFDGLDTGRRLEVSTAGYRRIYQYGEAVEFQASWNYPDWIERAELRIYSMADKSFTGAIAYPIEVVDVPISGNSTETLIWRGLKVPPTDDLRSGELTYTLRVYDRYGRHDETAPGSLFFSETLPDGPRQLDGENPVGGSPESRAIVSNIPVYGGSVTVHGKNIPYGYELIVMNERIPVDEGGRFLANRILPPGEHVVDVSLVSGTKQDSLEFERNIHIPDDEWFYVGLADLTIGKRLGPDSNLLHQVQPGEYSDTYHRGRIAFYVKGKIKGETLITAALDTTEEELEVLFSNLDRKDPRRLLRNLDPDDYYPVYGDDSSVVEDAPTSGKFYVRIERGKNRVLWGNFKTRINGTELARFERGLHGAHAHLETTFVTEHGEPFSEVEVFAAEPGSLPQRDEFRGTGGSAYFLRRQDINQGSEQVSIEQRDPVSGLIINRTILRPDQDYEIDYVQGIILLRRPLPSQSGSAGAVVSDVSAGNHQYLVAVYEYTPTLTDLDGFTYGGRAQTWLNNHVRVGVTGFVEDTGLADQNLFGADVLVRISPKTYFEFEWAQSEGSNFGYVTSLDGGFIFNPVSGANPGGVSVAWRAKAVADLSEATGGAISGSATGYFEQRDAGFNAPGRYTAVEETLVGGSVELAVSDNMELSAGFDQVTRADGQDRSEAEIELTRRIDANYVASIGILHSDFATPVGTSTGIGSRIDLGARITQETETGDRYWLFGQVTLASDETRRRNDRVGVGAEKNINDKFSSSGEISYGTTGIGGLAALNYHPNPADRYYFGYRLDPDTTAGDMNGYDPFGRDYGSIVYGANRKINDHVSVHFEENYDFSGSQQSLTHVYGFTLRPDEQITYSGNLEAGEVYDRTNGDFDRIAVSGSASIRDKVRHGSLRFEARFENGLNGSPTDRNTYLLSGQFGYMHEEDWRFIAHVDAVVSESDQSVVLDGDYVEGSVGWAYRPVDNDQLNALFRYTFLYDLPGPQQVNVQGQVLGPIQRSHVLSADFIYDVNEKLSVGGKYGFRTGEVSVDRSGSGFVSSTAHLAIARADFHVVSKWDLLVEARALWLSELDQVEFGLLAGIYHHLGENMKFGIGYNFGRFSDDLTDLTYDDEGVFVNLVGKY